MSESPYDHRLQGHFVKGSRVIYDGDYYAGEKPAGTVTRVQKDGYRIAWDDGYKDLPGPTGTYSDHEVRGEA